MNSPTLDSTLMAKVIFTNKLASKEQIQEAMAQVDSSSDIGMVLVRQGVLAAAVHAKLAEYVLRLQQDPKYQAAPRAVAAPSTGATAPRATSPAAQAPAPAKPDVTRRWDLYDDDDELEEVELPAEPSVPAGTLVFTALSELTAAVEVPPVAGLEQNSLTFGQASQAQVAHVAGVEDVNIAGGEELKEWREEVLSLEAPLPWVPRMKEVDDLLLRMFKLGELPLEEAHRRAFDNTRFLFI
jgi:hypothetical protein